MNIVFTRTSQIRDHKVTDGCRVHEVHIDGSFWGWVAGERRDFRAMSRTQYAWNSPKRTRGGAVEAARTAEGDQIALDVETALHVPTYTREVRLTADTLADADLTGWTISGGEDLGPVRSIRLTRDGFDNAMIVGERSRDVLGLPCTVTAYRD